MKRKTNGPSISQAKLTDVIAEHPHIRHIAQQHAKMLEVAIYRGNKAKAMAVVERAFQVLGDAVTYDPATRLDAILPPRISGILECSRITTIGQLCGLSRKELARLPQVRFSTVDKIEYDLAEIGLSLKSSPS